MTTTATTPKLFVTDYASYNEGTQFKYGHWVDLAEFDTVEDFEEYLQGHFEKSGIEDPEIMYTDFEGFPVYLYGESLNSDELEKIFKYKDLDIENFSNNDWLNHWNEYCQENSYFDDEIYIFDDEFFNTYFEGRPMEAARAASFGQLNWSDEYIYFNGYGNLESTDNPKDRIDENLLIEWLIDNA